MKATDNHAPPPPHSLLSGPGFLPQREAESDPSPPAAAAAAAFPGSNGSLGQRLPRCPGDDAPRTPPRTRPQASCLSLSPASLSDWRCRMSLASSRGRSKTETIEVRKGQIRVARFQNHIAGSHIGKQISKLQGKKARFMIVRMAKPFSQSLPNLNCKRKTFQIVLTEGLPLTRSVV